MTIMISELHKEWIKQPEYKKAYDNLEPQFDLARAVAMARSKAKLTQEKLATNIGAKQSNIARIESGSQNVTVKTLYKIANATGKKLKISFI